MTDAKSSTLDPAIAASGDPNQVAEMYANRLMDELFDGVERALEGDADALKLPFGTAKATGDAAAMPDVAFGDGGLPAVLLSNAAPLQSSADPLQAFYAPAAPIEAPATAIAQRPWWQQWTLNRLLIGAAGLSLLALAALWWLNQQRQAAPAVSPAPATAPSEVAASPDAEFLEYLRRSLEVISSQAPPPSGATSLPEVPLAFSNGALGLPPIGNPLPPGSVAMDPSGPAQINVIERVYIPYQAGPAQPAGVPSLGTPGVTAAPPAPASVQVLIGVLELGDRSAALFEINGVPQRVYIGERIGESGWSLVSVSNEQAMIRRNGEVRSIFIGQRF
ncbi:MAG: hypothetical protein IGR92_06530 [Leptolyngbyaceae cyanobacterium T60_A2020_046]|nr:hypothetical protein [Leptolyngbyaceae cyanobacterium T60_A2020_046]